MVAPPADARVAGSSPFCRYAALAYGDKAYSIQPHPEFDSDFVTDLLAARRGVLPDNIAHEAANSLGGKTSSQEFANWIADFFRQQR